MNNNKEKNQETFFYSIIHPTCSCRGEDGKPKRLGVLYREYYKKIQLDVSPIDIINQLVDEDGNKLTRMCCRTRFLSIPIVPMIDRSRNRMLNELDPKNVKKYDTKFPNPEENLSDNVEEQIDIDIEF